MGEERGAPDRLVFQGTADQLEAAGDDVPLLRALLDRRTNRACGAVFALIFGLGAVAALWQQDPRGILCLAALAAVGVVLWRRDTGREAVRDARSSRRARERYQAKGKYDGTIPVRIELIQGECRIWCQEAQPREVIDCRRFRSAVESEEILWIAGRRMPGLVLPKGLLVQGTEEELRIWLDPYVRKWKTLEIPKTWKEKMDIGR